MTEETPKEAIHEPAPQSVTDIVEKMVNALKMSKDATKYEDEAKDRQALIFIGGGSQATKNPTLYKYIKIAEKAVVREMHQVIIDKAGSLIKIELDKVRGLLG